MNPTKPFASKLFAFFKNIFSALQKVKRKWYILTLVILILLLPGILYFDFIYPFVSEQVSWQITKMKDTEEAYAKYKDEHYKGTHFEKAANRHAAILWKRVKDMNEPYKVKALVFDFEDEKYFGMAKQKYDVLLWDSVSTVNSSEAYSYYLETMKHGAMRSEAEEAVASLGLPANQDAPDDSLTDEEVMDQIMNQYEDTYGE